MTEKTTIAVSHHEIDPAKLSEHKAWLESTINFLIDKTEQCTDAKVEAIFFNRGIYGDTLTIELKIK